MLSVTGTSTLPVASVMQTISLFSPPLLVLCDYYLSIVCPTCPTSGKGGGWNRKVWPEGWGNGHVYIMKREGQGRTSCHVRIL